MREAKNLQKELTQEVIRLDKANAQQKQNEETLRELSNTINDVKKEIDSVDERR